MSGSEKISNRMDRKLGELTKKSNKEVIFRIHQTLRRENKEAYEPQMISIGPYHRDKHNLQKMEKCKLKYLQEVLERRGESSVKRYIVALMEAEEEARNYYDDEITLFSRDDFIEMMLLDGFFIIEFLRKNLNIEEQIRKGDPNFSSWSNMTLCRDLLLFENQLPFIILVKLFDMTKVPAGREEDDLIPLATSMLKEFIAPNAFYPFKSSDYSNINLRNVHHLLGLMYESWCSSYDHSTIEVEKESHNLPFELSKSAAELVVHGIKFRQSDSGIRSLFDIKYKDGVIEIPPLVIGDSTEPVLRNLIAYEEYMSGLGYAGKLVTDYAFLIDSLIDTSNDVRKLREKGIIKSWLGNNEEVARMINKICKNAYLNSTAYTYRKFFKEVNEHCRKRRHRWIAFLKNNYFSNPWSTISVVAATILLLLTFIQTIFTVK